MIPTLTVPIDILLGEQTYRTLSILGPQQAAALQQLAPDDLPLNLVNEVLLVLLRHHPDFADMNTQYASGTSLEDLIRQHEIVIQRFTGQVMDVVVLSPELLGGLK